VTRSMCGTSAFGLTSLYSAALKALAEEVKYGQDNDGMVAVQSCMLPGKIYTQHYSMQFYLSIINHIDGTCRTGNGIFGKVSRQPCLWLAGEKATMEELGASGKYTFLKENVPENQTTMMETVVV